MTTQIEPAGEDRRKHLELIQAVVTRMSTASTSVKSWLLPVVTAAYGFGVTKSSAPVTWLGIAAVVLFMYLDANYVRTERDYRSLYNTVARATRPVPPFSLDPSDAREPALPAGSWRDRAALAVRPWLPGWSTWLSWSILPFYGMLLLIGGAIMVSAA